MMRKLFALLPALLLCACTVGPNFKAPPPPAVSTYTAKGDAGPPKDQRLALGKTIEADWWTAFKSPALDTVIRLPGGLTPRLFEYCCSLTWTGDGDESYATVQVGT